MCSGLVIVNEQRKNDARRRAWQQISSIYIYGWICYFDKSGISLSFVRLFHLFFEIQNYHLCTDVSPDLRNNAIFRYVSNSKTLRYEISIDGMIGTASYIRL